MHRSYTRKRLKIYNARLIVSIIKSLRIAPSNERYFANYCNALFIEITVLTNIYSIFLQFFPPETVMLRLKIKSSIAWDWLKCQPKDRSSATPLHLRPEQTREKIPYASVRTNLSLPQTNCDSCCLRLCISARKCADRQFLLDYTGAP